MNKDPISLGCNLCFNYGHFMRVTKWDDEEDIGTHFTFTLVLYKPTFWQRIKWIFGFGEYIVDEVTLTEGDTKRLIEYLTEGQDK